jgi:hypothetical protein
MNKQSRDLGTVERWLHAVITHPQDVRAAVVCPEARRQIDISAAQIEQVVTRSLALTAFERLGIYSHAYFARLQECLRAEFSVLAQTLGVELFNRFTFDYLRHHPSRSYTLNRLGEDFPRYLAETRPDHEASPGARESWPDFIIDLAILERTFSEVFDGAGTEGQPALDLARCSAMPDQRLLETRFLPVVCLRLLAFRYPVSQYFHAMRKGEKPELPAPVDSYLAMSRRDYVVCFHELDFYQYNLLTAVISGQCPAESIAAASELRSIAPQWLRDWIAKGFFAGENEGISDY